MQPKPIDEGELAKEIIAQIKDTGHEHRKDSLHFFIYNTIPGTTGAATEKAAFLKEIILGKAKVEEIQKEAAPIRAEVSEPQVAELVEKTGEAIVKEAEAADQQVLVKETHAVAQTSRESEQVAELKAQMNKYI